MKVRNTGAERGKPGPPPGEGGRPPIYGATMRARSFHCPDALWARVISAAVVEGVSAAEFVRRAVERAV